VSPSRPDQPARDETMTEVPGSASAGSSGSADGDTFATTGDTHPAAPPRMSRPAPAPARATPLGAGARIDRFVIIEQRGAGGMGVVYRARDPGLNRDVAIKLLHPPRHAGAGRGQGMRLVREAQALAQLSHPNVVTVYDVGAHEESVFLAMEYIDGRTLDEVLAARRHGWREIVALFVQVGRGLAAMHVKGLIHRDIKPSNLIVDSAGQVRVGDFGLARLEEASTTTQPPAGLRATAAVSGTGPAAAPTIPGAPPSATLTADSAQTEESAQTPPLATPAPTPDGALLASPLTAVGAVVGTPRYMAPEQYRGVASRQSDQFSFCVALWEALYGEHPYGVTDREALTAAVLAGQRRPAPRGRGVPRRLERLVARGLATDAADRHPSMAALVEALVAAARRPRPLAIGGAAVAAAALGVALLVGRSPQVDCSRAGDRGAAAWSAARAGLVAAISGSGRPGAADSAARAAGLVDGWSDRWRAARVDACRATHDRGEQSAALLDRRMACLDRQLMARDAFVAALSAGADAAMFDRATRAAAGLPDSADCATDLDPDAPPRDPAKAAALAALDRALADVQARIILSADALPRAEEALALAVAYGDPRRRGRAHLWLGSALSRRDPGRSKREYDAAQADAVIAGDLSVQAVVLRKLLERAVAASDARSVETLLPLARAAMHGSGISADTRMHLAMNEAQALELLDRRDEADAACAEAVRISPPENRVESESVCACVMPMNRGRVGQAIPGCERALAAAEALYGQENTRVENQLEILWRAYLRANRLPEAKAAHARYIAMVRAFQGEVSYEYISALDGRAQIEEAMSTATNGAQSDAARATMAEALALFDRLDSPPLEDRADLLRALARQESMSGDCDAAVRHAREALKISEANLDPNAISTAKIYQHHSVIVANCPGHEAEAMTSMRKALALFERDPQNSNYGGTLTQLSLMLLKAKQVDEAIAVAERAIIALADDDTPFNLAIAHLNLGQALGKRGRKSWPRAREELGRAREGFAALDKTTQVEICDAILETLR
jgi:eukaryotic-like serine/threonine-protein kinase